MHLLPLITLLIIYHIYRRKNNNTFGLISYLIGVYLVMGSFSVILYYSGLYLSVYKYSVEAMLYMSICFIIIFWGFSNFRDKKLKFIKIGNRYTYHKVELFLIIVSIGAILYFLPFAIRGLIGDIRVNRIYTSEFQQVEMSRFGIINTFFSLTANLFLLPMIFSLINFASGKRYYKKAYVLLFSSLSYVVYILAFVGRDGIVYWIMSFLFLYLFMKGFLDNIVRQKIKRIFLIVALLIMIPFIAISISRFSLSNYGTIWEMSNYMGQQVKNFNDLYQVPPSINYGRGLFPLFINGIEKIGFTVPDSKYKLDMSGYFLSYGVRSNVFSTYVGSYYSSFGKIGTLFVIFIFSLISRNIINKINRSGSFVFSDIIIFILLYQMVLWGVFYFRQSSTNLYIVIMLFLFIYFKYQYSDIRSNIILKKLP